MFRAIHVFKASAAVIVALSGISLVPLQPGSLDESDAGPPSEPPPASQTEDPIQPDTPPDPEQPTEPPVNDPGVSTDVVQRPASVLGTGFFVRDGEIYDPNGHVFVMRGLNHTHWWGHQDNNNAAVDEFPKTGANAIRVVFGPNMGDDTPAERRAVVEHYLEQELVPIVEDHRGTCDQDPASLVSAVDEWLLPENQAWITQYERQVILNIANEWGPFDATIWANAYKDAITRLRSAGIHNLIMIDAGGACGQNPRSVRDKGQELLDHDPEHNLVFSVHMYAYWRTDEATDVGRWNDSGSQSPWSIRAEMEALRAARIPVVVGEIGWQDSPQVSYQTKQALQTLDAVGVGFLVWSWNQNSDSSLDLMRQGSGYTYNSDADLSPGGLLFLRDPDVGLEANAMPSTAFP